jgi:membrane-associated phospholipid phosphatase
MAYRTHGCTQIEHETFVKEHLVAAALCPLLALPAQAVTPISSREKTIENLGTGVAIALPLIAGGITLYKHDPKGSLQLVVETALTVGTAFALKNIVREQRPDGSDFQSFPSETTALAASGSAFLWRRYGWEYGLPAFAATQFVSYSRIQAKQHHWYDTLASSAIAAGYAYEIGTPFKKRYNINTELEAAPDGGLVRLSYQF